MMQPLKNFARGLVFHLKGIRFGLGHFSFLSLSLLPFVLTLVLYAGGLYLFSLSVDDLLRAVWDFDPQNSSRAFNWLHTLYWYSVTIVLYAVVLVVLFYLFIVLANIVASPFYDHLAGKYQRLRLAERGLPPVPGPQTSLLKILWEEIKKAVFMLAVPLVFFFIPVVGAPLAFVTAAVFIAWDYIDFSLSRDHPLFRTRMKAVWRYKFYFLGFGIPLLVPFVNLLLIPFAILGATRIYHDELQAKELRRPQASAS